MSIKITDLSYTYSPRTPFQKVALKNVSLEIRDGEFFGIIGHTGSGKSTLIQHLNGLIKLSSGKIEVDGIDLSVRYDYKKLRSSVGIVFQYPEYQLFDETVYKDVSFGPRNIGMSEEEIAVAVKKAIEEVGLNFSEIKERSPFELSGGQKRRVALAGVLAMRPRTLILDEPSAGLDPRGKKEIMSLIKCLNDSGTTIIFVSHNMDEIAEYCSRVAVLNDGGLVLADTPAKVFSDRQFLNSISLDIPAVGKIFEELEKRGMPDKNIIKKHELTGLLLKRFGKGGDV